MTASAGPTILNTDTGEVGGSSPPRPTNYFSKLPGVVPKTSTHNPTHTSLHHRAAHAKRRKILPLRRQCFIAVFLRTQIERRLNLAVTQDSLNGFRFDLRFVHQPVAKRVTQIVKTEPLTVLDVHSGFFCSRPQMIGDENRRRKRNTAARSQRRKHEVSILRLGTLFSPRAQMSGQNRVQRNDVLMQDSNFVDSAHDAPHLRNRSPCKTITIV